MSLAVSSLCRQQSPICVASSLQFVSLAVSNLCRYRSPVCVATSLQFVRLSQAVSNLCSYKYNKSDWSNRQEDGQGNNGWEWGNFKEYASTGKANSSDTDPHPGHQRAYIWYADGRCYYEKATTITPTNFLVPFLEQYVSVFGGPVDVVLKNRFIQVRKLFKQNFYRQIIYTDSCMVKVCIPLNPLTNTI